MVYVLGAFLIAVIKYPYESNLREKRVPLVGLHSEDTVHYGGDVMVAGSRGIWSHIFSLGAESNGCLC